VQIIDCEQGSGEWHRARLGIPTASEFGRIVTPAKLQFAAGRITYAAELLAEWALGESKEFRGTEWVERGEYLEPRALEYYALVEDIEPERVGLCLTDDGSAGASPDWLVGDNGLCECKCPSPAKHLEYLAANVVPRDYVAQVQGQLWVTGREWCDFMSYHEDLPTLLIRVEPRADFQAALSECIPKFCAELALARLRLLDAGVEPHVDLPLPAANGGPLDDPIPF